MQQKQYHEVTMGEQQIAGFNSLSFYIYCVRTEKNSKLNVTNKLCIT